MCSLQVMQVMGAHWKYCLQVMELMGAQVEWFPYAIKITGPGAFGQPIRGIDHDCNDIPDAAMTLAVAALFADRCVSFPGNTL